MSEKDFYFDEDDTEDSQPIEKAKAKEPVEASAEKAAPKARAPKAAAGRPVAAAAPVAPVTMQPVSMTVAALIGVVALLVGVIIGMFLPGQQPTATVTPGVPPAGMGSGAPAPQLTEDQLQGGQLPPGHPPLDQMGGGGAATPTADATPAPGGSMPATP